MTLQNIPSVSDLIKDASSVTELDIETIGILLEDAKALSAAATKVSRALQGEVEERFKKDIQQAYAAKGEDTGTIKLPVGAWTVEVNRPKKVEWDQKALQAIYQSIKDAGGDPQDFMEVNLVVTEKAYGAWTENTQAKFADARTVVPGNVSIKIKATA